MHIHIDVCMHACMHTIQVYLHTPTLKRYTHNIICTGFPAYNTYSIAFLDFSCSFFFSLSLSVFVQNKNLVCDNTQKKHPTIPEASNINFDQIGFRQYEYHNRFVDGISYESNGMECDEMRWSNDIGYQIHWNGFHVLSIH